MSRHGDTPESFYPHAEDLDSIVRQTTGVEGALRDGNYRDAERRMGMLARDAEALRSKLAARACSTRPCSLIR